MKTNKFKRNLGYVIIQLIILVMLVLIFSFIWGRNNFGGISMNEILFTLNMPLAGTSTEFLNGYLKDALCPALLIFAAELAVTLCIRYGIRKWDEKRGGFTEDEKLIRRSIAWGGRFAFVGIWAAVSVELLYSANETFGLEDFIRNQMTQSTFIEENYVAVEGTELTFPKEKRNLIYIFLESGETTNQDVASGGRFDVNYVPEMTQMAMENTSFSHSDLVEGAIVPPACGWTIAGMVAQTSGVPLKLFAYDNQSEKEIDNSMDQYAKFLPGVTSLGEVLEREGYRNYFMAGSEFEFGGRRSYFTQHGNYEVWDYHTAIEEGRIDPDYWVWWGFEDAKLYSYAKDELLEISKGEAPFNFSMITVDTHHVDGYVCELCGDVYEKQYGNVWNCASRQLYDFVEWVKQQAFYEDTTIVISGDHCSMDPSFYGTVSYDVHYGELERKVYNVIINPAKEAVREKKRQFTTLDMFPTTLGALGVEIEGNRLGLGTNLFSEEDTLAEIFGYDMLFDELDRKSVFYNRELLYSK